MYQKCFDQSGLDFWLGRYSYVTMKYFGNVQNPSKWGIYVCVIIYMCIIHIQTEGNFLEYSIQFLIFYFFFDNFVHVCNVS